eukprot:snap_masked-scaffold_1-processed-gene-21.17-mRNA-1 protein AED:0.19 eAED:0.20 QI:0/-1/0/1/-1/1/1/0/99
MKQFLRVNGIRELYFRGSARLSTATEKEKFMENLLKEKLKATTVNVTDISGGCGSMYDVKVESPLFKSKTKVAQHRMVNEVLKEEIKEMHGLTLDTKAS